MIIWKCFLTAVSSITFVSTAVSNNVDCSPDYHHKNGPRILPCVKELTLTMGQNYTLRCQGNTKLKFSQQEISEERLVKSFNVTTRTVKSESPEYKYEIVVDLINIDRYAIGYYACMDKSVKESETLNSLIMEPNDTEYISYIYLYVKGTDSLLAPMRELVTCKSNYYIVECRPTTPDVEVSLIASSDIAENYDYYSPKVGFVFDSDVLADSDTPQMLIFKCAFSKQAVSTENDVVFFKHQQNLSPPKIIGTTKEFLKGETVTLNCTVPYLTNSALEMTWEYPNNNINESGSVIEKNNNAVVSNLLYKAITIINATQEHEGKYTCFVRNNCVMKSDSYKLTFVEQAYLELTKGNKNPIIEHQLPTLILNVELDTYPPANFTFFKNNVLVKSSSHYNISYRDYSCEAILKITHTNVDDSANYTLVADNGYLNKSTNFDVRILSAPKIEFGKNDDQAYCVQGMRTSFHCVAKGYPLPEVKWMFNGNEFKSKTRFEIKSLYEVRAYLENVICVDGNLTCWAKNKISETIIRKELRQYELVDGFGISRQTTSIDQTQWYPENQNVTITCLASKYKFSNVTWLLHGYDVNKSVEYSENQYSLVANLKINKISPNDVGNYTCSAITFDGAMKSDEITIKVATREDAVLVMDHPSKEVYPFQPVHLSCLAQGVPRPTIEWYKDSEPVLNDSNVVLDYNTLNHKTVNSSITIYQMQNENTGMYECAAISDKKVSQFFELNIKTEAALTKYLIIIGVIVVIFILLVIYLTWRDKKRKQRFKKELAKAGLLYFKKGATRSLNPELGIDEQAELLPYDERFEFAPEKLILGKQLGAGAFGVVYKADARGIINAEETTTVAVKMVKKTADNMYIKALASELKIMIHLGKHINIVNLLGACTRNVVKRELVVIVEYCKFGNIHNYMQRHREVFIDQLSDNTKENNLGKVNIGFSHSGSTGVQSEYFGGSVNTQDTSLNSANTNRPRQNVPNPPTEVAKASESYIQPEWRSNYDGDYSYEGRSPRPLSSRDLISWAFQIARGMEYLANRKVLHGDLAARNVLLADDNIVKICDFGLARSMYKNDEYKKKENSPLPVKWLAIECMTDQIFSTQSDVWSFGVVLWELFTLAKTPYPNISPADILRYLMEGHRLNKPQYADDKIYNLMKRCWEQKPTARPTFSQLQEILDSYLEDSVRNHYVHLSSAYMDSRPAEQEDYLAMVCAPDYNNMVTPSPHHYVNNTKSFFPNTPTKVDEAGYQQMSSVSDNGIHSPKPVSPKFDFDARTFNTRPSEASNGGSELTPMLTLNNLPRSGSDSDHEGPVSPYLNAPCPTIDEDEVFEEKQKRNVQNTAVTNPTYITFNIDDEKKPLPVTNYVNVPNGLVK